MDSSPIIYKPVSFSQIVITELMIPSYANFGGKIHGGILLSLMDKAAYACSAKHSGRYCVTVTVDNVEFLQPVEVGNLVSLAASVNYVGNTSLVVGIRVTAEDVKHGIVKHTNTSYFTMVAKDDEDKPTVVPGLILENSEDIRRFVEAVKRKELKSQYKKELNKAKVNLTLEEELEKVKKEKFKIQLSGQ